MKESEIRFFKPLWRRLLLLGSVLTWTVVELIFGSELWLLASLCLFAYVLWRYLLRFPPEESEK